MTDSYSFSDDLEPDPDLDILAECHEKWESVPSEDRDAVIRDCCAKYPHLEGRLLALIEGVAIVGGMRDPERLGPYRIDGELGIGGMGKVYEAEDEVLNRRVAVKTIRLGRLAQRGLVERFLNERRILARLHHTNIVPIFGAGEEDGLLYFAMPRLRGATLAGLLRTTARLSSGDGTSMPRTCWDELVELAASDEAIERNRRLMAASPGVTPTAKPAESPNLVPTTTPGLSEPTGLPQEYRRRVVEILAVAAEAVDGAHGLGVLHRDLKPSNIFVEFVREPAASPPRRPFLGRFLPMRTLDAGPTRSKTSLHPWVLDFGLAQGFAANGHGISENRNLINNKYNHFTTDSSIRGAGTPGYMAPEALEGAKRSKSNGSPPPGDDPRRNAAHAPRPPVPPIGRYSDVWSLGVTLYQLLTLRMPFENEAEVLDPDTRPKPLRGLVPDIPKELEAICLRALNKAPGERYPTAAAFATDLRRWLGGRPTQAGKAGPVKRTAMWAKRRPAAAIATSMTAAFLLVAGLVAVQSHRRRIDREHAEMEKAQAQLESERREREVVALPQLRKPIRKQAWFDDYGRRVDSLRGGSTSPDPLLQGQAAAALEGIDARVVKSFPGATARAMAFDARSERLLFVREGEAEGGRRWFQTVLWDRETDRSLAERDLGAGVVAFRADGPAIQLSWDRADRALLRLFDVESGQERRAFRSPLEGSSALPAAVLSRDGSRLAALACPDRRETERLIVESDGATTIAVWDVDSERPIRVLEHKATRDLILSPDGSLLAARDDAGEITVWVLFDGERLPPFRVGRCPVSCLAFGRDPAWQGKTSVPPWLLAVGESSGLITVWDLRARRPRSTCRGSYIGVRVMDFSADGALLLTGDRSPTKLWDVATGSCLLDLNSSDHLQAIAFAPDGRHFAVGSAPPSAPENASVEVAELELGHGVRTLYGVQGRVEKTAFSPDGRRVAAATHEWQVGIWEWPSGRLLGVVPAPVGQFVDNLGMAFDADGRRFACSAGHQAQLWDLQAGRLVGTWSLPEGLCESLAFPDPGRLLLVRSETRSGKEGPFGHVSPRDDPRVVRIYDLLSPGGATALHEIPDFPWHVDSIALAPNGSTFVVDGRVRVRDRPLQRCRLYEGPSGRFLRDIPTSGPGRPSFDPSGAAVAVLLNPPGGPPRFGLFEIPSLKLRGTAAVGNWYCLSPGAERSLGRTTEPSALILHDLARDRPLLRVAEDAQAHHLSFNFSPDGRYAMFGRDDGTVSVLNLAEINVRLSRSRLGW